MSVFTDEDEVGLVKEFGVGEYEGNKVPIRFTKGKVVKFGSKEIKSMCVEVFYKDEWVDVTEAPYDELFEEN